MLKEANTSTTSEIKLSVNLDSNQMLQTISWAATDSNENQLQPCKAFVLAIWDGIKENSSYQVNLWTKDMRTDEMDCFFLEMLLTLSKMYSNANGNQAIANEIEAFAYHFGEKSGLLKKKE